MLDGSIDWSTVLFPTTLILEIVVRGTVMYLGVFALLRMIMKRPTGAISLSELLVVVLLADASQNGMADGYRSIFDGLVLVVTIMGWNKGLNYLSYRFPRFQNVVTPSPLVLVRDGNPQREAMRRELVTDEELGMLLRLREVRRLEEVEEARLEGLGGFSVLRRQHQGASDGN